MSRSGSYVSVKNVRRKLRKVPKELSKDIRKHVADTAKRIENDAKAAAPVDQGILRKYLTSKTSNDGFTALIGYRTKTARRKAFYAAFVEFGTSAYHRGDKRLAVNSKTTKILRRVVGSRKAQQFMFPAAEANRKRFIAGSKLALKNTLRRLNSYNRSN